MVTLAISCVTTSNLPWFMDLTFQVPMQYCSYSIRLYFHHPSHPQLGVVFAWLHPFILSGVISPLISSSLLGTYQPGEFIFQCHTFLSFHTVHGVLKTRILKLAIPFSIGPHFVRTLHHDPSILGGSTRHGSKFHWARQGCGLCDQFGKFSVIVVFILFALWWIRIRGLWKLPDGRDWLRGKLGLVLMGGAIFSKSLIQFSVDEQGFVSSLLLDLRPNHGGVNEDNGNLLQRSHVGTAAVSASHPEAGHCRPTPLPETPGRSWACLGQFLVGY